MEIRKINLSIFILSCLVIASLAFYAVAQENSTANENIFLDSDQDGLADSEEKAYQTDPKNRDTDGDSYSDGAEVRSGYDPLKPAPGDKLGSVENTISPQVLGEQIKKSSGSQVSPVEIPDAASENSDEDNLTQKMAERISAISTSENPEEVSLEDIQTMVEDALSASNTQPELPEITEDQIKIKKENYKGLSAAEIKTKKKEEFLNYITAVYYIFSSNSPRPVTSMSSLSGLSSELLNQVLLSVSTRNPEILGELSSSGQKIFDNMLEVEVPEHLAEIHIKGLRFAQYAQNMKDNLKPNPDDPIADIAGLSQIRGLLDQLSAFSGDVTAKIAEYDISYDESVKEKLKENGLFAPEDTTENEEAMRSLVPQE